MENQDLQGEDEEHNKLDIDTEFDKILEIYHRLRSLFLLCSGFNIDMLFHQMFDSWGVVASHVIEIPAHSGQQEQRVLTTSHWTQQQNNIKFIMADVKEEEGRDAKRENGELGKREALKLMKRRNLILKNEERLTLRRIKEILRKETRERSEEDIEFLGRYSKTTNEVLKRKEKKRVLEERSKEVYTILYKITL